MGESCVLTVLRLESPRIRLQRRPSSFYEQINSSLREKRDFQQAAKQPYIIAALRPFSLQRREPGFLSCRGKFLFIYMGAIRSSAWGESDCFPSPGHAPAPPKCCRGGGAEQRKEAPAECENSSGGGSPCVRGGGKGVVSMRLWMPAPSSPSYERGSACESTGSQLGGRKFAPSLWRCSLCLLSPPLRRLGDSFPSQAAQPDSVLGLISYEGKKQASRPRG